jgi:hypothetical protein
VLDAAGGVDTRVRFVEEPALSGHPPDDLKANRAREDEEQRHQKERAEELRVDGSVDASDRADQRSDRRADQE